MLPIGVPDVIPPFDNKKCGARPCFEQDAFPSVARERVGDGEWGGRWRGGRWYRVTYEVRFRYV